MNNRTLATPLNVPQGMNQWVRAVTSFIEREMRRSSDSTLTGTRQRNIANGISSDVKLYTSQGQVVGEFGPFGPEQDNDPTYFKIARLFVKGMGFQILQERASATSTRIFSTSDIDLFSLPNVTVWGSAVTFPTLPTTASSASAHLTAGGVLMRVTSSRKNKIDIEEIAIEDARAVLNLRPVTFREKAHPDGTRIVGLIAEEVDEATSGGVLNALVGRSENGEVDSVNYDRVTLALIAVVKDQAERIAALEDALKGLTGGTDTR